jgi:hypothetical protein
MTPYERLVIAIRHGVLVRKADTMKFAADVVHQSARPNGGDRFTVVPVMAATMEEAARKVAEIAAARRFEEMGNVGYLQATPTLGWFRAAIGQQRKSADGITLSGVTIIIHVWAAE